METSISICLGIALAAACGFRVFVPPLVLAIASRAGLVTLVSAFQWMASDAAIVAFAVASGAEVAAYYVPWVDNLLDAIAGPAAVVAGVVVSASVLGGMDPWLRWTLAAIAGGGAAGAVQALSTGARLVTTVKTVGLGNPVVATTEAVGALGLSALAVVIPVLAALVAAALVAGFVLIARRVARR